MTAHERTELLMSWLVSQSHAPGFLRPSEIQAQVEDQIRIAVLEERELCAVSIEQTEHGRMDSRLARAIRNRGPA